MSDDRVPTPPPSTLAVLRREPALVRGLAGSPGLAFGKALVVGDMRTTFVRRALERDELDAEMQRFASAVDRAKTALREVSARLIGPARDTTAILEAYLLMLSDPMLTEMVERNVREKRKCAEWAVSDACDEIGRAFDGMADSDAYLRERRHDVDFVCDRLLRALVGAAASPLRLKEPAIIVARDLSPADTAQMAREPVLGIVTELGTRTSHTSILARALGMPAVVGAHDALQTVRTGDDLIVDGLAGTVLVNASPDDLARAKARAAAYAAYSQKLLTAHGHAGRTSCGTGIALRANVELAAEAMLATEHGAEGIGLYRTEFLYIERRDLPTVDEQYEVYRAIAETMRPRPITLRTFDLGGDKFTSRFPLAPELNPALGLRAVRLALRHPELLHAQLVAMVRASAHGDVRIMVPMVTTVSEMRAVRSAFNRALSDVDAMGLPRAEKIPLGMMIEVPAAAILADLFTKEADFFSIGTNDLVQYSLATDRSSGKLAGLASPLDPAILRLVSLVVAAANAASVPVSVCGTMASDPFSACLLVGLGIRELSMVSSAIPEVKEALVRARLDELESLALGCRACDTADGVFSLLEETLGPRLVDLLSREGATFSPRHPNGA